MTFREQLDLASERVGGAVVYATDDYFAAKENLLQAAAPVWREHEYTDRGKWMDGWESRRKRVPGHDFAIVRLGVRGLIRGAVVDTAFFRGNFPESCSIEIADLRPDASIEQLLAAEWSEILPRSPLQGNTENLFEPCAERAASHVRLNIFPDGGVARLRLHGEAVPDWRATGGLGIEIDVAAAENGGDVLSCSDMFFGPKHNLIMPGRALNMSDGWETRRRRGPGHDWVIVRLAAEGLIHRIEIDTNHFKGNFPDTCSIDGSTDGDDWRELLPKTKLQAHQRHFFIEELLSSGPWRFVRLNAFPDGGVSRLRVWGLATAAGRREAAVKHVNTLLADGDLLRVCASRRWVQRFSAARPFASWEEMTASAASIWLDLDEADWLEAFAAHARIGERRAGWSTQEQSGAASADVQTRSALADAVRDYESKFGFVYLICATGKSAQEMLADARERLGNERKAEVRRAADEQRRITELRLEKLVTT
jgi:allantoicase